MEEFLLERNVTGGGVLMSTQPWFQSLNDELGMTLDIVLDVDGRTELVFDFPNEDWHQVWSRFATRITELCNSGTISMCVLKSRTYRIRIAVNEIIPGDAEYFSNLRVDGEIYVAEVGNFLVDLFSDYEYSFWTVSALPGLYAVYYLLENHDQMPLLTFFLKEVNNFSGMTTSALAIID